MHAKRARRLADGVGDFVLGFHGLRPALDPDERRLVLEEAQRLGLGIEYDHGAYAASLCLTVGKGRRVPHPRRVRAALKLIQAVVAGGRTAPPVQYCFYPDPYSPGHFVELYKGDLNAFTEGVDS